jgi:hypothetical protein
MTITATVGPTKGVRTTMTKGELTSLPHRFDGPKDGDFVAPIEVARGKQSVNEKTAKR